MSPRPSHDGMAGTAIVDGSSHLHVHGPLRVRRVPRPWRRPNGARSRTWGNRPRSWLPTKVTIGTAGIVLAIAVVLLARRERLVATGLLVAFVAVAAPWFIEDGYEQTMRNGRPVCCGREIDRDPVRTGIVLVGASIGAPLAAAGVARSHRRQVNPSGVPHT
jgi:hypothetical protein